MTAKSETVRTGTFEEFKQFTLAVVRGERQVDPNEPKIWIEQRQPPAPAATDDSQKLTYPKHARSTA